MITDDSRLHQWILFQKTLFEKHPARNPTYGSAESVKKFDKSHVSHYYFMHYIPNNMVISVIGNVDDAKGKIEKYFGKPAYLWFPWSGQNGASYNDKRAARVGCFSDNLNLVGYSNLN